MHYGAFRYNSFRYNIEATKNLSKLQHLFDNNTAWAKSVTDGDPDFFNRSAQGQTPEYLWIGCADSRVPPNQLLSLAPGEIFVHRNIANVVVADDISCLSVIQFAVEALKVKHIIVCGHYRCGGVNAAIDDKPLGLIDNWLAHIKKIKDHYADELAPLSLEQKQARLAELNVIEQVKNVCQTDTVQKTWDNGTALSVHGWIYDLGSGTLKDLNTDIESNDDL